MPDLIDGLGYNDKTTRQIREAVAPGSRLFDVLDVGGRDAQRVNFNGAVLLVSDTGLRFVRTRLFGKPTIDDISWPEVRGFEVVPGQGISVLKTSSGDWLVMQGASAYEAKVSNAEREQRMHDRLMALGNAIGEARHASAALGA